MRNAELARQTLHRRGLALCFRPQPVVDGHGQKLRGALPAFFEIFDPTRRDDQQRR